MNRHRIAQSFGPSATFFAPAKRATDQQLRIDISVVSNNALVDALLRTVGGLLAVLNEERQIVALNSELLRVLGIQDAETVLGLRPGEALGCVHSHEMPGGCGTSRFCSGCGAVLAIVASMAANQPVERKCIATVERNGKQEEICLRVRSSPLVLAEQRFLLLFLNDITQSEKWASLERAFFHDISNIVTGIMGAAELMQFKDEKGKVDLSKQIVQLAQRLSSEVKIQRDLNDEKMCDYRISSCNVSLSDVIKAVSEVFANHPAALGKRLAMPEGRMDGILVTDLNLLLRVLTNMLLNALEASEEGDEVKFAIERANSRITFSVWNRQPIPQQVSLRIFQRHFSTKPGAGRGIGTFAMKLFGEQFLGGHLDFYSTDAFGTVFRFSLPEHTC